MAGLFGGLQSPATTTTSASNNTMGDLKNDVALCSQPEDSITDLTFSPGPQPNDYLAVSSWDKKVRIYEIDGSGKSEGKHMYQHDAPVFSVDFSKDGTKLVSAGADKQAKVCDLPTQQTHQIAEHEQPVRCCRFFEAPSSNSPMVVTGSWDRTIKYWDLRTPSPVATVTCQERVYSMDVRDKLLVVACADRYLSVINLNDPTKIYKSSQSPLKWQTRTVSCFTDAMGFAIGSIEGRCAIQNIEEKDTHLNFSFKCHRETGVQPGNQTQIYSVNDISFHPVQGTFSTAGSDGSFHFWDKDAKHRLKGYPSVGGSITATAFSKTGNIFGYAISYDWSKGFSHNSPQYPTKVMLHPVGPEECKPRQQGPKKR